MAKVTIFVEGISDKIFIRAFVSHHYNIDLIVEDKQKAPLIGDIISLGGKSKLEDAQVILEMKKQIGYTNLLILDADNPEKNAGFEKVKSEITNIIEQKNLAIDDFFLFPNHQDDGDLEDLLIQTVNPKNQVIFDCWKAYESCLQDIKIEGRTETLTTPIKKAQIEAYLSALLNNSNKQQKKAKVINRDYQNKDHWNLDTEALNPLKQFFDKYFHKQNEAK